MPTLDPNILLEGEFFATMDKLFELAPKIRGLTHLAVSREWGSLNHSTRTWGRGADVSKSDPLKHPVDDPVTAGATSEVATPPGLEPCRPGCPEPTEFGICPRCGADRPPLDSGSVLMPRELLAGHADQLAHALSTVLPMVKGYAAEHRAGRNEEIADWAGAVLQDWIDAGYAPNPLSERRGGPGNASMDCHARTCAAVQGGNGMPSGNPCDCGYAPPKTRTEP